MNAYIGLCLFIIIAAFLFNGNVNYKHDKFIKIAFLAMFVIYAFRDVTTIGVDSTTSYLLDYQEINTMNLSIHTKNFMFFYFMKWIHSLTKGDYQLYNIILAIFITYSFYRLVRKYSYNPLVSIMWYIGMLYYIFMFSGLKQGIAMAILTWAFDAVMEEKAIKFYILVFLAATFHVPALVFLPGMIISKIKIGRSYIILLAFIFTVVFIFRGRILDIMNSFYESGEEMHLEDTKFIGNKVLIMLFIIIVALIIKSISDNDRMYRILLMYMGIAAVLQTFCYYNNIFERLADYYYQFSIIFMPHLFSNLDRRRSSLNSQTLGFAQEMGPIVISIFALWRFSSYINSAAANFLPYTFFWSK